MKCGGHGRQWCVKAHVHAICINAHTDIEAVQPQCDGIRKRAAAAAATAFCRSNPLHMHTGTREVVWSLGAPAALQYACVGSRSIAGLIV
eukprot:365084-Chlamydomonas_euryale.AAC.2